MVNNQHLALDVSQFLNELQPQLEALALVWLESGASAFLLVRDNEPLMQWPEYPGTHRLTMSVPVTLHFGYCFDVCVVGIDDATARRRLAVDAQLISQLLQQLATGYLMTEQLVRQQDQQLALYRLTQALRGHATVEETLRSLTFETHDLLGAQAAFSVFLPGNDQPILVQYPEGKCDETLLWSLFWETHAGERALLLPGETDIPLPATVRNVLIVPLSLQGNVGGALGLINGPRPEFSSVEVKLTQAIVDQVGTLLENVLLSQEMYKQAQLQGEMQLARAVQSNLLSQQTPSVNGLDIYATTRPALHVGGDFYTMVYRAGRPFVFSVGDISGKGLSAALLMTMTRTSIHSKASYMPDPTPEVIMRQSNEDLYDDFARLGTFATVLVGQYQPITEEFIYANAGHAPVIYRPHDGVARLLKAESTAMGILPVVLCKNQSVPMREGDLLVIGTDGLSDASNAAGETFGSDRLLELVDQFAFHSAPELADILLAEIQGFEGGSAGADDQTLMVIKAVKHTSEH